MEFITLEKKVNEQGAIEVELTASAEDVHELLADFYSTIASVKRLSEDTPWDEIEAKAEGSFPPDYFKEVRRDFVVNRLVGEALSQLGVVPALTPKIHALQYPADGESYEVGVSVVERPQLTLSSYDPVEVEMDEVVVDDQMVAAKVAEFLDAFADFEEAPDRPVERGDYVLADITTQVNDKTDKDLSGTKTIFYVDEGRMPETFIREVLGMNPGETKVVKYTYARPRGISKEDVDRYVVTITVHGQRTKVEPALDEVFVHRNFPQVSSVEEFLTELRKDMEYDAMVANKDTVVHLGNTVLEKRLQGFIPDEFYQASYTSQMNKLERDLKKDGKTLQDYYDEHETNEEEVSVQMLVKAGESLRQGFALETLFEGRGMQLEPADLQEAARRLFGMEEYDEAALRSTGRFRLVEDAAKRMKAISWMVETAVVVAPKGE